MSRQMFPHVKRVWDSYSEDDKREISRISQIICRTVNNNTTRKICQEKIQELCAKYGVIRHDCGKIANDPTFSDEVVSPKSEIQFVKGYFLQFVEASPDSVDGEQPVKFSTVRRFLVRNGYHGDIVVELSRETPGSYYFNYIKDGEVIFEDWRVLKNSGRVLEELF